MITPKLVIFGGPNGSGKTSLYKEKIQRHSNLPYLNPDEYAARLGSEIEGAKRMLKERRELLARKQSFITETTLSGSGPLSLIKKARIAGYNVELLYVCINKKLNPKRVAERFRHGGHNVPLEDILRRYERSLENLATVLKSVDTAHVYDNSGKFPRHILSTQSGTLTINESIQALDWIAGRIS